MAHPIDWDIIEQEYIAGIRPLRDIAKDHDISHTAIRKHADKHNWTRNLARKIETRRERILAAGFTVTGSPFEEEVIENVARGQAAILFNHQSSIDKYQQLCNCFFEEIYTQTVKLEDLQRLGELMAESDNSRVNALYKKIIDTPSRIDSMKKLVETYKTLVGLERQAHGIADNANGDANQKDITPVIPSDPFEAYKRMISIGRNV